MASTGARSVREEFRVHGQPEPISHYTDAVRFGDVLYVSGVAPLDAAGNLVGGKDPAAQTRQILTNMRSILNAAGADFRDVLKVTVYLTDVKDRHAINPVRQEFFGRFRPASTLIGISELAIPGMKVEIEAVAGIPRRRGRSAVAKRLAKGAGKPARKTAARKATKVARKAARPVRG